MNQNTGTKQSLYSIALTYLDTYYSLHSSPADPHNFLKNPPASLKSVLHKIKQKLLLFLKQSTTKEKKLQVHTNKRINHLPPTISLVCVIPKRQKGKENLQHFISFFCTIKKFTNLNSKGNRHIPRKHSKKKKKKGLSSQCFHFNFKNRFLYQQAKQVSI